MIVPRVVNLPDLITLYLSTSMVVHLFGAMTVQLIVLVQIQVYIVVIDIDVVIVYIDTDLILLTTYFVPYILPQYVST